ncbi:MAG: SAM-dependent methyltransferase [Clostridia bacterium]|nr:SAM-dependent methyltransferase [Clostridia bacterium]
MSILGNRLNTVTDLLKKCENNHLFADIGSDHAFLAIEVLRQGLCKKAIAADINEMPLLKGKENAQNFGVDIEFILSDGFDNLEGLGITSAAICGMGGELIAKIVLRSETAKNALLILQPMSAQDELRKALWDNGFVIHKEVFVYDSGKPYTVMQVTFTGENTEYSYLDLFLGKERIVTDEFKKYCQKVLQSAIKRRLGIIARGESTDDIDNLIEYCQTQTTNF